MKKLYVSLDCKLCGGKIMIKGAKGAKVKVVFQGLHMTCHFCVGL